jgi:CPA1 family monovalent cation:H+ antiporter
LLAVLVVAVLLSAVARRLNVSAPLALVLAGLMAGLSPASRRSSSTPSWCCS